MKKQAIATAVLISALSGAAHAQQAIQLLAGTVNMTAEVSASANYFGSSTSYSTSTDDSGGIFGAGYVLKNQYEYIGAHLYVPNVDDTDTLIAEASYHRMVTPNVYAGLTGGYMYFKSDSDDTELDLSGLTFGASAGLLLLDDRLDINFKYRFLNGDSDSFEMNESGVDITSKVELESSFQLTAAYNFML